MKTTHLVLLLMFLVTGLASAFGQSSPRPAPASTASVSLYRSRAWLSWTRSYWVYANGKPVCKIRNNRHCQIALPAGPITFTTRLAGFALVPKQQSSLTITLEPGKSYYLQADLKTKLFPLQAVLPLTEVVPNPEKLDK